MGPPTPEFLEHVSQRQARLRTELVGIIPANSAIVLEIGSGHGHFLARYAHEFPEKSCIGVDVRGERVERAQRKATRAKLPNCHFIRAEAREMIECLPPGVTFAEIWVLFPDPWPKKRHHKNRILQAPFLDFVAERSQPTTKLYFRTDHADYFRFATRHVPQSRSWQLDPTAAWPLEHETVFQARAPSYQSWVAIRKADPSIPIETAPRVQPAPADPTSPA